jgi:hypothetical protein
MFPNYPATKRVQRGSGLIPIGHHLHRQADHDVCTVSSLAEKPEDDVIEQDAQLWAVTEAQEIHALHRPRISGHTLAHQVGHSFKAHLVRLARASTATEVAY